MMRCEFDVKSRFYALIILSIALNSIRAELNIFEIKDTKDFTDRVINSKDPVLAQFAAQWSPPSRKFSPHLKSAVKELNGKLKLANVDLQSSELQNLAVEQGIGFIPTLVLYKDGKIVNKMVGLRDPDAIKRFLKKQLKKAGVPRD